MKVALLGYNAEGKSSYEYYKRQGAEITICDQNPDLAVPNGVATQLGPNYLHNLDRFDVLVRTAGMPPRVILEQNPSVADKITSNTNEFMRVCPTKNIIGVTGTKGKGTTTTLIAKMLTAAGRNAHLGGNIGIPPLSLLDKLTPESWVVLELSSFQLIDLQHSPHLGVCLMVVPEHLNWHDDLPNYLEAKSHLFAQQSSDDIAVYFAESDTSREIAAAGAGHKFPFYRSPGAFVNGNMLTINGAAICRTDELKLLGKHNWQNACAAITAVWLSGVRNPEVIRSVLTTFEGLEYHLELVRELDGVRYYNDSFGTTPETAIVALQAFAEPKVLILGGSDKGIDFDGLAREIKAATIRQILLIGNPDNALHPTAAAKIETALRTHGIEDVTSLVKPGGPGMAEVAEAARAAAKPGDVVLLSTAAASFDTFPNYKVRGAEFTKAINALH